MAQSFVTTAGTLIIPGAYSTITVQQSNSSLAANGVLFLIGEAEAGPDFTQESDLGSNKFGPDQLADVQAKYKSGNLVDAFKGAIVAADDAQIQGAFTSAIMVKTNVSARASATLLRYDSSTYGTLQDRSFGKLGNLISYKVTAKVSEVVPTTGAFTYLPPIAATDIALRVNGGAATTVTATALMLPPAFVSLVDAVAGIDVGGGQDETALTSVTGTLALAVNSGNNVTVTRSVNFQFAGGVIPSAGDTMYIPSGSVLAAANAAAAGSYIITAATATTITATKLLDVTGAFNALTPPTAKTATNQAANTDVQVFQAVTVHLVTATNPISGVGKSLEFAELTTNTGRISANCYTTPTAPVAATFISKSGTPVINVSAAEYIANLNASRQLDGISEDLSITGGVALTIGYQGTTASAVVDGVNMTITVTGGSGSSPAAIPLKNYPTISDLAAYVNTLTGFTAAPGTAVLGAQPSTSLDQGTYTFASTNGGAPGRIKQDAYRFFSKLSTDAVLVQLAAQPTAGQPGPMTGVAFLSGGTKGGTTDATVLAALNALALTRGNFVVPLFSRDATGDIADGLTESTSTYTIAAVHTNARAHVLQMSTLKARRNRQAFLSFRGTFANAQTTAANLASSRCSLSFQDVGDTSATTGSIVQFQPWMNAVKAAGMQAAGFYKAIFRKGINITKAVQAAGDYNDQDDSATENALIAGLLTIRRDETGGFFYASDQTTYTKDNNFFFNSIQAVYAGDVVALTTAQRMEKAFVGQSVADISASVALSTLDGIMADLMRLKLIAPSDDAPKGYLDPKIQIKGPAMIVSVQVKLAGAIYFIPISFSITQVQQSA